jgi:hypothetical protein
LKASKPLLPLALFALSFVVAMFVLRQPSAGTRAQPIPRVRYPGAPAIQVRSAGTAGTASVTLAPPSDVAAPAPASTASLDSRPIESIVEAIDTLENSLSPDDRVRAIHSLAAHARDGIEVTRVRASFRLAAIDENPDVAARAQEEYEALVERDDR